MAERKEQTGFGDGEVSVPAQPEPSEQRRVILVVEDEVLVRLAVALHLREAGYTVIEAVDAADAMRVLIAVPVSLVFADINLPGPMDGSALADWIDRTRPHVRVLMTSGRHAGDTSARPFISKPYDFQSLVEMIDGLVGRRRSTPTG
jgi:DNA-binding response OmpR family regulator